MTPPKEFEGVGSALSTIRREEAETGLLHVTARKLGALFEDLLPSTPSLTAAYGRRASEISQCSSITSGGRESYGMFGSRIGADAASLWAAATSGQGAIAVHLLACLLARMWEGPEATSIWVEIVKCRKEEIISKFQTDDIASLASLAASKQDLTRTQLREWDASARAWLRAADVVKQRQQKQLMLIIDNVKAPVNRKSDTYESVMSAWTDSMTKMESLIQGISQKAQSGDVLLALSAWHLFPDMMIVDPCVVNVKQNDQTFTCGVVLTIGLENTSCGSTGVYWSLPLAHLRHYGAPVISARSIDSGERSRISLDEFLQAFLGSFLQGWHEAGSDTNVSIRWLSFVSDIIHESAQAGSQEACLLIKDECKSSWLNLLLLAAKNHLSLSGNERLIAIKLVSLGRKHGKAFLGMPNSPVFGLLDKGAYIGLIQDEEERISYLRKVANEIISKMGIAERQVFIRYKHTYTQQPICVYEYATALPWSRGNLKRKRCEPAYVQGHFRWLSGGRNLKRVQDPRYYARLDERYPKNQARNLPQRQDTPVNLAHYQSPSDNSSSFLNRTGFLDLYKIESVPTDFKGWFETRGLRREREWTDRHCFLAEHASDIREKFEARKKQYESKGEIIFERDHQSIEDFAISEMGIFWDLSGIDEEPSSPWFRFMYGDLDSAALFVTEGCEELVNLCLDSKQEFYNLFSLSEARKLNPDTLIDKLTSRLRMINVEADPHIKSLKAVSTAAMLYRNFPTDTTIDIRVLQQSLYAVKWVTQLRRRDFPPSTKGLGILALQPYVLDRVNSFACITMFESGTYDIDPRDLENVMAMSSGDSLYISTTLLRDPIETDSGSIQRVAGNIGRPGIAFLVSPVDPLIKEVLLEEWPQKVHRQFDGEFQDCFKSTSLHLSFTGASDSLHVGFTGAQDIEVYILETTISVHECGKWIADIHPLEICRSIKLRRLLPCACCNNRQTRRERLETTCIDNWLELIDAPEANVSLVRAHKNWQARLAATSISIQMDFNTVILPENACHSCLESVRSSQFERIIFVG